MNGSAGLMDDANRTHTHTHTHREREEEEEEDRNVARMARVEDLCQKRQN